MRPWHLEMFRPVWRPVIFSLDGAICSALGHSMMLLWILEAQRDGAV